MSVRDRVAIHSAPDARTGVVQCVCAICAFIVAGCSPNSGPELAEVFSAELAIESATPAIAASQLRPGVYLVEVRERGIDLRVGLDHGPAHQEFSDAIQRHGLHAEVVRLAAPAEIRVTLHSADHRDKHGNATVKISRWAYAPDAAADELELGYAEFGRAGRETSLADPGAWVRAADALRKASAHFTGAGALERRAQAEYSLGSLEYLLRTQWQPAIRAAETASDAYESIGDAVGQHRAAILRSEADLEVASEMSADAQRTEQKALLALADKRLSAAADYLGKRGERLDQARAINIRGQIQLALGDDPRAARFFNEANVISREVQDPITLGNTLSNLALIDSRRGEIARAASEYQALLPLLDRDRDPDRYAAIVGNYGVCLIALGEFDRALELHAQALEVFTARGADGDRARQLNALGGLYMRIGEFDRALATLRAASELNRQVGNSSGRAQSLRLAGNAAAALGDTRTSLAYLRESLTLDANSENVARTRVLMARQVRVLGDLARAESELGQALTSGNGLTRARALVERAALRRAQGNNAAALADLRAADELFATLGLDFDRIDTHAAMSQTLLALGDVAGASVAADAAIATEQRIRIKSANPEWRARFLAASYAPYEARIAVDLAAARGGDELAAWRAFRTAEAVRARSLADQLAASSTRDEMPDDPSGNALRARLTAEQIRLETRILRQDADDNATNELRRSIAETRALIDAHSLRLSSRRNDARAIASLPESLDVVKAAIPAETAVLAFFVGDEASHAWLLSREGLTHRQLAGRAELERVAHAAVAAQRSATGTSRPAGTRAATRAMLGSLLDRTRSKRLLLIPDGPLNGIPFGALPINDAGSEILIDRFVLGYAPSMSLAMSKPARPAAQHSRVVVVSDPIYARDDSRLRLAMAGDHSSFRGSVPEPARAFTRLPYSSVEARAVARAFAPGQTIDLSGFDATTARVLQLTSEKMAVLHFATHAIARQDSPDQSALFLSEYGADGVPLADSQLSADQIARSGLHADLVVLSGCATGDGGAVRGEGVLGLTYAFLANGSRSVIASLWPIQDASTARLMKEFYASYRSSGRAADALRAAQLRMRDSTAWASFVVRANDFP